jgi:serine/threonine protein kinase
MDINIQNDSFTLRLDNMNLKDKLVDIVWVYIPTHTTEFEHMSPLDETLEEDKSHIGIYKILDTIGTGQHSVVKRCHKMCNEVDDTEVAVKSIKKRELLGINDIKKLNNEIKALKTLCSDSFHPNIVRYHNCYHGIRNFYIVTEYVKQDLVIA